MDKKYIQSLAPNTPILSQSLNRDYQDKQFNTSQSKKLFSENNETSDQISFFDSQQQQLGLSTHKKRVELSKIVSKKYNYNDKQYTEGSQLTSQQNNSQFLSSMMFNRKNSLNYEKANQISMLENKQGRSYSQKQVNLKEYFQNMLRKGQSKQAPNQNNHTNLSPYFSVVDLQNSIEKKLGTTQDSIIPPHFQDKKFQYTNKNINDSNFLSEQKNLLNLVDKITNQSKDYQNTSKDDSVNRSFIPSQIHNETMLRTSKMNVLPNIQPVAQNTAHIDIRNYADLSSLENHRVDLLDQKLGDKEYFDTPLLFPSQIKQVEVQRLYKEQNIYQQFNSKGFEYNKDIDYIKRADKSKIINLQDLSQMDMSKDQAFKLLQSFQNNSSKSILHLPLNNKYKNVTSRKDVEDLELWLNQMTLQIVQNQKVDGPNLFQTLQQIYSACLHELVRQVSLQCLERGNLIKKVWESYIGLFQRIIQRKSDETLKIESQALAETTRLHKNYQSQIKDLENKLRESQKSHDHVKDKYKKLQFLNKQYQDKIKELELLNTQKTNEINELKYNISVIQNDNNRIANYLKEIGIVDEFKSNNKKISLDLVAAVAKSSELIQIGQQVSSSFSDKQELKGKCIHRSVSLNTDFSEDLKFIKKKENEDLYYRIKSDPLIIFVSNEISKSDANNKGVDTQELNKFADHQQNKLEKQIKMLRNQLSNSKIKLSELQEKHQKREKSIFNSRQLQNSPSLLSRQRSIQGEFQMLNSRQSFCQIKPIICPNCQHKFTDNPNEIIYPNSPNNSISRNSGFQQGNQLDLNIQVNDKSLSIFDQASPSPSRKTSKDTNIDAKKIKRPSQKIKQSQNSQTKNNIMSSLTHIQEEEGNTLTSPVMNNRSSILEKLSNQDSQTSIKQSKGQSSRAFDKNKHTNKSSRVSQNLSNVQQSNQEEYELYLNEFYSEAKEYLNTEVKKDEISNLAKTLDQLNQHGNDNQSIKQFLDHFAKARNYLNEKLRQSGESNNASNKTTNNKQFNLSIPLEITTPVNSKQTPRGSNTQKPVSKKSIQTPLSNKKKINSNKQIGAAGVSNPKIITINQNKVVSAEQKSSINQQNQTLTSSGSLITPKSNLQKSITQQQQQVNQQQQQYFEQQIQQSYNLKPLEAKDLKQVPSISEDVERYENDTFQEKLKKIMKTLQFQNQLIQDLLNYLEFSSLPSELQQQIQLWREVESLSNLNHVMNSLTLQYTSKEDRKNKIGIPEIQSEEFSKDLDSSPYLNSPENNRRKSKLTQEHLITPISSRLGQNRNNLENFKDTYTPRVDRQTGQKGEDMTTSMRANITRNSIFTHSPRGYISNNTNNMRGSVSPHQDLHSVDQNSKLSQSRIQQIQSKLIILDDGRLKRYSMSQQQIGSKENLNDQYLEGGPMNINMYTKRGEKKKNEKNISINFEASNKIVLQVIDKKQSNQVRAYLSKLNLIKFISVVYQERIKIAQNYNNKLHTIAYDYLLNKYGLKRVAEKKLAQTFETCYFYPDIPRIKLFANFIQLYPDSDCFDKDEFNFYINMLKYLDEKTNSGIGLIQNNSDRIFCSLERVIEYMQTYFEKESFKYNDQIIEKIQQIVINVGNQQVVDIDETFCIIVNLYKKKKEETGNNVKKLFYAADLDKNDCIELNEFITIYRYLEKETFDKEKVTQLFLNSADIITSEGEKAFSLDRFAVVCLDNQLFSLKKQQKFSQSFDEKDYIKSIDDLTKNFNKKFKEIKGRLQYANEYTKQYTDIIESIHQLIQPHNLQDNANKDMLWISYRLLDEESKRLFIEKLVLDLVPDEFLAIQHSQEELYQNPIDQDDI